MSKLRVIRHMVQELIGICESDEDVFEGPVDTLIGFSYEHSKYDGSMRAFIVKTIDAELQRWEREKKDQRV